MIAFLGLLVVFIFEYIRPSTWVPALGPVGTIVALSVLALSLMVKSENGNAEILKERNSRLMLVYLSLVVISVMTAEITEFAFNRFKTVLGYFFLFFMITRLVTDVRRLRLLFALLVLIHITILFLNPKLILNPETRNYLSNAGFLGDGNDFALSVCIALPMAIFLYLEARSFWMRLFYAGTVLLLLIGIVGTQSRGATLALGVVLLYQWYRGRSKLLGIMAGVVVILVILAFAPASYYQRLETIRDYEHESSAAFRLIIWQSAIRMANDNPVLGVGAGHFSVNFGTRYRPPGETTTSMPWQNAHSIYFMTLAELGYPGLTVLLAIFISNWIAHGRRMREARRLPAAAAMTQRRLFICIDSSLIAFAVAGAFLSGIYYPHIYLLAGLSAAIALQFRRVAASAIEAVPQQDESNVGENPAEAPPLNATGGADRP